MEKLRNSRSRGFKKSYYDPKIEKRALKKEEIVISNDGDATGPQNKNTTA